MSKRKRLLRNLEQTLLNEESQSLVCEALYAHEHHVLAATDYDIAVLKTRADHSHTLDRASNVRNAYCDALLAELAPDLRDAPSESCAAIVHTVQATIGELFAGCGGFAHAARILDAKVVYFAEIDQEARQVYLRCQNAKPEDLVGDDGDVHSIRALPFVHMMTAGPPCTKHSKLGSYDGFSDKYTGRLIFETLRLMQQSQPCCALIENVQTFATLRYRGVTCLKLVERAIARIGWHMVAHAIDALDMGVPQSRKRVYLACFRYKNHHTAYLQALDDDDSSVRRAIRARTVGIADIAEQDVCPLSHPDLFISPEMLTSSRWRNNIYRVHTIDSMQPAWCLTSSAYMDGFGSTYICRRTKAQLGLTPDHPGHLKYAQYCDIGIWRLSDIEMHRIMGYRAPIAWVNARKSHRTRLLGNSVVPAVVEPVMSTMMEAIGFQKIPMRTDPMYMFEFTGGTTCPNEHLVRNMFGVPVHSFRCIGRAVTHDAISVSAGNDP